MSAPESSAKAFAIENINFSDFIDWADILEKHGPDIGFDGNIDQAATLMAVFGEGRNYIRRFFAGKLEIVYPEIWIRDDEESDGPLVFDYTSEDGLTCGTVIEKRFLEGAASYEPTDLRLFYQVGKFALPGPLRELFFLAGVEETHHAVFRHLYPDYDDVAQRKVARPGAEYTALEVEWQAQHFKIRAAQDQNMPIDIITRLIREKTEAGLVRQRQGLPVGKVPFLE